MPLKITLYEVALYGGLSATLEYSLRRTSLGSYVNDWLETHDLTEIVPNWIKSYSTIGMVLLMLFCSLSPSLSVKEPFSATIQVEIQIAGFKVEVSSTEFRVGVVPDAAPVAPVAQEQSHTKKPREAPPAVVIDSWKIITYGGWILLIAMTVHLVRLQRRWRQQYTPPPEIPRDVSSEEPPMEGAPEVHEHGPRDEDVVQPESSEPSAQGSMPLPGDHPAEATEAAGVGDAHACSEESDASVPPMEEVPPVAAQSQGSAAKGDRKAAEEWRKKAWECPVGDYDKALIYYTRAIELDPSYATAWFQRGYVNYLKGESDQAIVDFSEVLRLDPTDKYSWSSRARAYEGIGAYDKAIVDHSERIRLDPTDKYSWSSRARAYEGIGAYDKAIADYSERIRLDPTDKYSWTFRAQAYEKNGAYDKSIVDHSERIRLDPTDKDSWTFRAWAYEKNGAYDNAIADHNERIRLDPTDEFSLSYRAWSTKRLVRTTSPLRTSTKRYALIRRMNTLKRRSRDFVKR